MNRQIAIIHEKPECAQNVSKTVDILMTNCPETNITVFTRIPNGSFNVAHERCTCSNDVIPAEMDSEPKVRNWINKRYSSAGFVHVISEQIELLKDPMQFMRDLENAMTVLDYPLWLNTACDGCNFVYSRYNPRMKIQCDREECKKLGLNCDIFFTSHSNTQWVCYDMKALSGSDLLRFDERFTIPMFFIIELLARRRNTKQKGSLFYMNQYLTVSSEYGTFKSVEQTSKDQSDQKKMVEEDAIFKSMNINYGSDNNVDEILETLWEKICEKSGKAV